MPRYMETAAQLALSVQTFLDHIHGVDEDLDPDQLKAKREDAHQLGYIINLAVRCAPRSVQSTVRRNIVERAIRPYCTVTMNKFEDPDTKRTYNKISIMPKPVKRPERDNLAEQMVATAQTPTTPMPTTSTPEKEDN